MFAGAAEYRADEGNLADRELIVWIGDEFLVPERTPTEVAELRRNVDDLARDLGGADVVPLDVAVDPTSSETQAGETARPPVAVGRPVGPQTRRFSGIAFVATPELLSFLDIDPATIGTGTTLLTYLRGDAYLIADKPVGPFASDPVPDDAAKRIEPPAYSSLPRSLVTQHGLSAGGWQPATAGWLVHAQHAITDAQLRDARRTAAALGVSIESARPTVRARFTSHGRDHRRRAVRARDPRDDDRAAARRVGPGCTHAHRGGRDDGDAPGAQRNHCGRVLAGLGVLLAGVSAYASLLAGYWPDVEKLGNVPVRQLLVIAVGLPLLAEARAGCSRGVNPTTSVACHSTERGPSRDVSVKRVREPALGRASGIRTRGEAMSEVARVTEISSRSTQGFEDAIKVGIERANNSLRGVRSAWVKEQQVIVDGGSITEYQVNLLVTFVLE